MTPPALPAAVAAIGCAIIPAGVRRPTDRLEPATMTISEIPNR